MGRGAKRRREEIVEEVSCLSNAAFRELQNVLEHQFREFHAQGVGTERQQAEVIEEQILWEKGVLPRKTPLGLLNSVLL